MAESRCRKEIIMHLKRHRKALIILSFACLILLAGCAKKPAELVTVDPQPQQTAAPAPSPSVVSLEEQRAILEANRALWAFSDPYESPWFYSFVDLDRNGRQEVIAACTQGTGVFTYAHYYEITPDFAGVRNLYHEGVEVEGPDDWPEIVTDRLPCYYDAAADRYYYACEGVTREGAAHQYFAWYALCLKDGVADWERLAEKNVEWDENGAEHVTCSDAGGAPITAADYDSAVTRRFEGMESTVIRLEWTQVDNPAGEAQPSLLDEPAFSGVPLQTQTPPASDTSADPGVAVTKNPSSEALAIGGRTWFIAHADNGSAPAWLLQSPDEQIYTLADAMAAHPGLDLQVLPQDTIAVSNVPLSLNGWAVLARFDGPGGSVLTEPAYLFIGDFLGSYAPVIDNYRAAFTSGRRTDIGYLMENNLSELSAYSSGVGYALKDLDKNGVPELLIAGISTTEPTFDKCIYDVYTLDGSIPTRLAVSMARQRYFVRTDGSLYWEGSGGAGYAYYVVEQVKGKTVEQTESLFTDLTADNQMAYYSRKGPLDGADASNSTALSEADFQARVKALESTIYLPPLTKIA